MTNKYLIIDKDSFITGASDFFNELFDSALANELGEIEIRTFKPASQHFCKSETEAAEIAYNLCNEGIGAYFGVNSRTGKGGKKENVQYLNAFHAEVDYGVTGHKKEPTHKTYNEAFSAIRNFPIEPTIINHTGGGFHCYWPLLNPIKVADIGVETLEAINKALSDKIGGDAGTQDISRVLRIPGTFNFKIPDNPRHVTLISNTHKKCSMEDFMSLIAPSDTVQTSVTIPPADPVSDKKTVKRATVCSPGISVGPSATGPLDINTLPVSDRIKSLIKTGNDGFYPSRSEADMVVITALVSKGISESVIRQIFQIEAIGDKYRGHPKRDVYLKHSIEAAKKLSDLTEDEMADPLFISGAITKSGNKYGLNVLRLEEYIVRKYRLKLLDQERAMFRYKDNCYEVCTEKALNKLCQDELGIHRNLFTKSALSEIIHFATGDVLVNSDDVKRDQISYLAVQNGLYSISEDRLVPHTPDIFTTNKLPFDYDPNATCPRFLQFLDEIFLSDKGKIHFIQEAVGYVFHKAIPTPAMFFLIGNGSNGKSVFINTIANLVGEENTCNISFNLLSDEKYILELYQKMLNISGETPHNRNINTDIIKAVTAGDTVTGKQLYKDPMKFRPFAKSFLAMNEAPSIKDNSHGMWRRIWVIEFPRKFEDYEMDRDLENKLKSELSGIFNWALEGYRRLREKKFALHESDSMRTAKSEYRGSTDSVRAFIADNLKKSENDRIKLSELYNQYETYCQTEGLKIVEKKNQFRKTLEDMKFEVSNSSKDGNQCFVFNVRTSE